jgi:competence protein ComEC
MALLDGVARLAASVPGGVLPIAPTLTTALGAGLAAVLVVRGTAARRGAPWYVAAAGTAVFALWLPLLVPATGDLEMHVLDVGQGDAIALRTPRGRWILVDAGRRWRGGDAGRRMVIPYLRRRGGALALFVLSHPHDDHAGGASSVVRALRPRVWWEPAFVTVSPGYREALAAVRIVGTAWSRVSPGKKFSLDGVSLTVLAPDSAWTAAQDDANETSVVVRVEHGRTRFLLTGDAERDEEAWLLSHYRPDELAADVLKLGHHGSRTSSSAALLDAVAPRLAIASVGAGNGYGHPAPETLGALLQRGIAALRTDLDGTVVVRSNGRELSVETGGERWILPSGTGVR